MLTEKLRIDRIHCSKIAEIGDEHLRGGDVRQAASARSENCREIHENLPGLRLDAAFNQLPGLRIERYLSRAEQHRAGAHRLRIRPDCSRRGVAVDGL